MGERERRKAVMARTWTRRSFAGGLAAIAAVLLALALAATTRTNALEVTSSETYYVPVRLRGNLYLVSLTQTSFSYDVGSEEAEEERETFFPKVSTFDGDGVSAAGLLKEEEEAEGGEGGGLAAASQKSGAGDTSDEEDPIDFVEEEDVEEDVEEEVEQEQEEKDAFEESTDVDLYWLQQQIDLLAQFDSALSLDSVYNQAGPGRPCRHHRRGGRGGHFRHSHQRGGRRDGR